MRRNSQLFSRHLATLMGSGCSSPLRRFGGKKGKQVRDSISEIGDNVDPNQITIAAKVETEQNKQSTKEAGSDLVIQENEITIQSEANEDFPSSASCNTDSKTQTENGRRQLANEQICDSPNIVNAGPAARALGLTGGITPHDRHLLVSPALSPAPSLSQSPAPTSSYQQVSKQKIFTIKENHRHVVAIYPDKNSLAVWDIYDEKAVRIINDIDHPRDLRMVDQKRAVILCNRELCVYDLELGTFLIKLKGVMNQKMPYFEIFGQDYVIALARNRMYVNMLNINTGQLETTFKVGEDRFLNSLLVSADGGICVCGDETQKPFPLLVWNLNERRLMYDLRLERHEFITRMSAISDDGHFVVSVCKQIGDDPSSSSSSANLNVASSPGIYRTCPNFIVIYDLNSGTLFKRLKPGLDTCGVAITLSSNRSGKLINSITDNSILVWDLTTGLQRHTLTGHTAPPDVIKVQNNRLFSMDSTGKDQSLRIWDIEEGYCMEVFNPEVAVSCCQMSIGGDALVCGFAGEFKLSTMIMCKNELVDDDSLKRSERRKSSKSMSSSDEPTSKKPSS